MTMGGSDHDFAANGHDFTDGAADTRRRPPNNSVTRFHPQEFFGEVFIERCPGTDAWRAAWMCMDERDVMIASELGPQSATLVQCISWAILGAKPARVSINLLT